MCDIFCMRTIVTSYQKLRPAKRFLVAAICNAIVSACSTPAQPPLTPAVDTPYELREDYTSGVIHYTVRNGDTLHDIAEDYTGDGDNWQALAAINKIANANKLLPGTVVQIPSTLIPGYEDKRVVRMNAQSPPAVLAIKTAEPLEVAPVLVATAKPNREFELQPIDPNDPSKSQGVAVMSSNTATGAQQYDSATHVIVIGSYVPQGVYEEPAPYSRLMMRASPGTKFLLLSQVNDWFKIETDKGIGFIRTSDATVSK